IVDSMIALCRVDFSGRGELAEHQQKLAQMIFRLTKIAEEFNVAVYISNQDYNLAPPLFHLLLIQVVVCVEVYK
ncbi:hypothetical protein EJB05_09590, partial [Eragrostis curvula]